MPSFYYGLVMNESSQAPATKQDVSMIMSEIGKLYDANERWKDGLELKMLTWKEEIIHDFKVFAENLHYDLVGVHKDKISNHEDRIVRIEDAIGLQSQ